MTHDKETAYAWNTIITKVQELRNNGYTLEAIGNILGVRKTTVSRWISSGRGGERTTFGDILRYAKRLNIAPQELTDETFFTSTFTPSDLPYLTVDYTTIKKAVPPTDSKRIFIDVPEWMVEQLNSEAQRIGTDRQSLIKVWLADKLSKQSS